MTKIFIDGSAGTTGLKIRERLSLRPELSVQVLEGDARKDPSARRDALNGADIAFLCLPDAAAEEDVSLLEDPETVIIDTSTAHRTSPGWVYGFAELKGQRAKIAASKRIANPGCHASGFIALIAPLVREGLLSADAGLSCFSLTGYSGGGKKMIADYETPERAEALLAPRMYGLNGAHKHLREMQTVCSLKRLPLFSPIVSSYYAGMQVTVPIYKEELSCTAAELKEFYRSYYTGRLIRYSESEENGFLSSGSFAGKDSMEISVYGNEEILYLISRFDNLGKGASGAAIQNMNVVLGLAEDTGLII